MPTRRARPARGCNLILSRRTCEIASGPSHYQAGVVWTLNRQSPEDLVNVHKNATLTPRGRAALVRLVTHQGLSVSAASARIGVSRTTVYRWLCRATEFGDRSSRPRRLARLHPPGELLHVDVKKLARITRGPGHRIHRYRLSAPRVAVVLAPAYSRRARDDGQRESLSQSRPHRGYSCGRGPAALHPAVSPLHERQGRALHPHPAHRVGFRPAGGGARSLPLVLQYRTAPREHWLHHASAAARDLPVTNVSINYT